MNGMNNKRNCGLYGNNTKILRDDLESLQIYIVTQGVRWFRFIYITLMMIIVILFDIKNYAHKEFVKILVVTCLMKLNVGTY